MIKRWSLACRAIAHRPGFAAAVVFILALGIGANTAMFSIVNTVLLKPLPFPQADRLVTVMEASPSKSEKASLIAPGRLADWNRLNRTFEIIGASYSENVADTSGSEPERLAGRRVSPRYFDVFRMKPIVGRTFNAQEEAANGPLSALISYSLWTRRYNKASDILDRRLMFGGRVCSIVGVTPEAFATKSVDLWLPAQIDPFLCASATPVSLAA